MLSIGIYWDRIRESEAPKIHVMGLGQRDRKEKKKYCRGKKKKIFFDTPQLKLTSLIHCVVMELHQNKSKKMKWDIGKATDIAFGVGMQSVS